MAGDVQSLDEARRARDAGVDEVAVARRAAAANIYVTRAEEALVLLSASGDEMSRMAFRRITESWLELATAELSTLPHHA